MIKHLGFFAPVILLLTLTCGAAGQSIDLAKWQRLKVGMTEAEAIAIMGQPASRDKPAGNRDRLFYLTIVPKGQLFQSALAFLLWIDTDTGRINSIETPACGGVAKSGAPGRPEIFIPLPNSRFSYYPRFLDIRWCPPSGDYPMTYDVGVELENFKLVNGQSVRTNTYRPVRVVEPSDFKTAVPYLNYVFDGAQKGRVRVRGANSYGTGPWSDYVGFEFLR
jgi:hypothetical protein